MVEPVLGIADQGGEDDGLFAAGAVLRGDDGERGDVDQREPGERRVDRLPRCECGRLAPAGVQLRGDPYTRRIWHGVFRSQPDAVAVRLGRDGSQQRYGRQVADQVAQPVSLGIRIGAGVTLVGFEDLAECCLGAEEGIDAPLSAATNQLHQQLDVTVERRGGRVGGAEKNPGLVSLLHHVHLGVQPGEHLLAGRRLLSRQAGQLVDHQGLGAGQALLG